MDNDQIADIFSFLAKLMDIYGDNGFRAKTYANAAFQLEKVTTPLAEMHTNAIAALRGVGESVAKKIEEILNSGKLALLDEYLQKIPEGVVEMLKIKGIGPKKINTIWKEMGVENIGELLYACNENRLTLFKGFGEKTQQTVKENIEFYQRNLGSFLFSEAEEPAQKILEQLQNALAPAHVAMVGSIPMHDDIIEILNFVTDAEEEKIIKFLENSSINYELEKKVFHIKLEASFKIKIEKVSSNIFFETVFTKNCSAEFLQKIIEKLGTKTLNDFNNDAEIFSLIGVENIPPHLRHSSKILTQNYLQNIIETKNIKGIIHSHSNWSDGSQSIEEMANAAVQKGFEYLVISDHSKTAAYAKGLEIERVKAQHQHIDELNEKLQPFKIFKSIESDILNDGSLDYPDNVLSTFDLIIASVHSNLKMPEDKAMSRLLKAIENPFTTILGHMTGRLLLSRPGYPLDHEKIIDACIANKVVIEINAHPRRLDVDWRWVSQIIEKGGLVSINPDAHTTAGFDDIKFGVIAAQKALLTAEHNLSSFSLEAFEKFLEKKKV